LRDPLLRYLPSPKQPSTDDLLACLPNVIASPTQ